MRFHSGLRLCRIHRPVTHGGKRTAGRFLGTAHGPMATTGQDHLCFLPLALRGSFSRDMPGTLPARQFLAFTSISTAAAGATCAGTAFLITDVLGSGLPSLSIASVEY